MPMWIRYFAPWTKGDTALWCKLRVRNLAKYVESLEEK